MSRVISPVTGKPYGLATVCRIWQLARSGVYRHLSTSPPPMAQRRGPRGAMSDEALTTAIRGVLAASPFHDSGNTARAQSSVSFADRVHALDFL